jgi:hypothetical protein
LRKYPARGNVGDQKWKVCTVGEETSKPIGLVIVEDMIARAEAACEKVRAKLTTSPSVNSLIDGRRRAKLHAMEDTLARLKAQQDDPVP